MHSLTEIVSQRVESSKVFLKRASLCFVKIEQLCALCFVFHIVLLEKL